jgi:hypothetical protein
MSLNARKECHQRIENLNRSIASNGEESDDLLILEIKSLRGKLKN